MENINLKKQLAAAILLIMWAVAMYNSILMDIQFQNSFAITDGEHSTATRMGFIMPIIGGSLLIPIAELYRKQKFILWGLGFFMFTLLTAYQLHGNLGYFANQNESYESNGSVTTFLKSQLNAVDNQINITKPIAGNFDSAAIEKQIESNLTALEKCPKNHATLCINPIRNKLNALYEKRELASNAGSANMQIAMAVKSRGELIKQLTVSSSELDNAKAHPAFKAGSTFFTGSIDSAKEYQAKFLSWQSVLLLLICETLPAIVFGMLDIRVLDFERPALPHWPSFLRTRAVADGLVQKSASEQVDAVKMSAPAPPPDEAERGHAESDVTGTSESAYSDSGIGFSAIIKHKRTDVPQRTVQQANTKDVPRPSIGAEDSTYSGTEQKKGTTSKGRGKSAGLEFQVIDNAIISGDFFKFKDTASIRNLVDYSRFISPNGSGIGKDTASVYMTMLKERSRPLSKKQWENLKGQ